MSTTHAAISPSRAADFSKCPLKFRYRTIDRLPEPPSSAALRGTIVHAVLEHLFDRPRHERTERAAQDLLEPTWAAHLEKAPQARELFDTEEELAEWLESARPLISSYFTLENPQNLEPSGREQFINATLPSGLAIRGIIDRVDTAANGAVRVVDYKTGKSPSPRFQDEALFQMRFYAAALYYATGNLPARTQLVYLGDGRILSYDPTESDVTEVTERVDHLWSAIEERLNAGYFEPKKSALCSWCHFQDHCPEFGGEPLPLPADGVAKLRTAKRASGNSVEKVERHLVKSVDDMYAR